MATRLTMLHAMAIPPTTIPMATATMPTEAIITRTTKRPVRGKKKLGHGLGCRYYSFRR